MPFIRRSRKKRKRPYGYRPRRKYRRYRRVRPARLYRPLPERKHIDTAVTFQDLSLTGQLLLLTDIDQGTGPNERVGDQITAVGLNTKIRVNFEGGGLVRWAIFVWHIDASISPPSVTDIYNSPGDPTSTFNYARRKNYTILRGGIVNLNTGAPLLEAAETNKLISFHKRMRRKIQYSGTVSEINGQIYFVCYSSVVGPPAPDLRITSRVFYLDN